MRRVFFEPRVPRRRCDRATKQRTTLITLKIERHAMSKTPSCWALCVAAAISAVVCIQPAHAQKILFHGADVDATAGADGSVLEYLNQTYDVTYMQGEMAAGDGSSADGFDAIIISSTLNSGTVRGKYADTPLGLMNWEQALNRQAEGEFNMSVGGATGNDQTEITIVDPTSPLAAGLSGTITVFDSPSTTQWGTGDLGAGVNLVASSVAGTEHAIFSADVGDALLGDGSPNNPAVAPGRRVMWFIQDSSFDALTPEGLMLFDAAVAYVVPEPTAALSGLLGGLVFLSMYRRRRG